MRNSESVKRINLKLADIQKANSLKRIQKLGPFSKRTPAYPLSLTSRKKDSEVASVYCSERKTHKSRRTLSDGAFDLESRKVAKKPLNHLEVIKVFPKILSSYEKTEISNYSRIYYLGKQNKVNPELGFDDPECYYRVVKGDHIAYRYEVVCILGKGCFGEVVKAFDHKKGGYLAIKILRNTETSQVQGLVEVNILRDLRENSGAKSNVVKLKKHFKFRSHLCLCFELLDMSLYEFLKKKSVKSISTVKKVGYQILKGLEEIHNMGVIHCDLKPENVMLNRSLEVKIIDLGTSCYFNSNYFTYIQSRFYRAPEVILGLSYSRPIDMWSFGCVLAEILTGRPLFPGENEFDQLSCIMQLLKPPPSYILKNSLRKHLFFEGNKLRVQRNSRGQIRLPGSSSLERHLKTTDLGFLDLLSKCFEWDPGKRITAKEALKHKFFKQRVPSKKPRRLFRHKSMLFFS